ncbi:MAG: hypothetical protein MUF19_00130 [Candidatus Pacebacteria bacterium]|jgi:hypothetical protein|nr:hypothetical protein [Candidatus Paceibacterota bacterium]
MKLLINLIVICSLGVAATPSIADESQATSGASVVAMITEHFPDKAKTMKAIAKCESGLVHRENGRLLPNRKGSTARGAFQVLMRVHGPEMKKMGLDPNNDDDYMEYVRHLVDEQGLAPWAESKSCWKRAVG